MALISVIIPVYNTSAFLERCMRSVLGQTHTDLEVIMINDGSTDNSGELCDAWAAEDARVKVIHQANGGLSRARNAGLEIATGDYIAFVDSDDWIEPDMYAYLLGLLEQTQAEIAEATHEVAYSINHQMRSVPEKVEVFEGDDILIRYFEHNEFGMWLRLYKSETFADVRFDAGRINEDVVAGFLALRNASRLVTSNQPKVYYYSNPVGISESPLRQRDLDLLFAGERLDELTADMGQEASAIRIRQLALTKKYRSPFTLLVKMAIFGCSAELDEKQISRELHASVREHYGFLMRSNMPFNRKIMLTGVRFCYPLFKIAGSIYHFILRRRS
jgi:glycosyltransferase involved in cell wall biosynthesis